MVNKVILIGRLGRDPELRYSSAGMPIASLRIATDESYVDRDGNKVDRTEWHTVVVFQRTAENCANFLSKGSLVYVEGSLQTRKWQDQQGQDRYSTEVKALRVQFLDRKGGRDSSQDSFQSGDAGWQGAEGSYQGGGGRAGSRPEAARAPQPSSSDDLGPAFPSEASGMDDVPF
jgi:single-strand DNA-binding protein